MSEEAAGAGRSGARSGAEGEARRARRARWSAPCWLAVTNAVVACCAPNKPSLESSGPEGREEPAGKRGEAPEERRAALAGMREEGRPSQELRAALLLGPAVVVPWRQLPTAEIVDVPVSAEGAEGAKKIPARSYLELVGSPAGWAGRVMLADGTSSAVAVRGGRGGAQVMVVGPSALAVSARSDGMWVLFRDRLVRWDAGGAPQQTVMLEAGAATAMVGAAGDAVWLVGEQQAWRVEGDGRMRGPYAWEPGRVFTREDALCRQVAQGGRKRLCLKLEALGAGAARGAAGLDEELESAGVRERGGLGKALGEELRRADTGSQRMLRPLPFAIAPGEEVLWFSDEEMITKSAAPGTLLLRSRSAGASRLSLAIAAAGLDAVQRSFAVTSEDEALAVWRQSASGETSSVSPEGRRFSSEIGSPEAASIEAGEVAFYARGRRISHQGDGPLVSGVDEERYRHEVFPSAWALSPRGAVAVWGQGEVAVATSGPDGIAVLPVSFSAPPPAR